MIKTKKESPQHKKSLSGSCINMKEFEEKKREKLSE
jgi:hypothetical protein